MNYAIPFFFIYLIISGMILGLSENWRADKCGGHTAIESSDVFEAALWPMGIGTAITIDGNRNIDICAK